MALELKLFSFKRTFPLFLFAASLFGQTKVPTLDSNGNLVIGASVLQGRSFSFQTSAGNGDSLSANTFSQPGYVVNWNWGDGTKGPCTDYNDPLTYFCTSSHTYTSSGPHTVTVSGLGSGTPRMLNFYSMLGVGQIVGSFDWLNQSGLSLEFDDNQFTGALPDFSNVSGLGYIAFGFLGNTNLNAFSFSSPGSFATQTGLYNFFAEDSGLSASTTNQILNDFAALPTRSPCISSFAGASNSLPTGQGLIDVATILDRGWGVSFKDLLLLDSAGTLTFSSTATTISTIVAGHSNLKALEAYNFASLTGDPSGLSSLSSLISVDLSHSGVSGSLPDFTSLVNLKYLNCEGCSSVSGSALTGISAATELRLLAINGTHYPIVLPDISGLTKLEYLDLGSTGLTGYTSGSLRTQDKLYYISFDSNALPSADVNAILADIVVSLSLPGRMSLPRNYWVSLSAGTNGAPTGQGVIDANLLRSFGWVVTTN